MGKSIIYCTIMESYKISFPLKTFNLLLKICISSFLISIQSPEKKRNLQQLITKNSNWMMLMNNYTRISTLTILIINYQHKKLITRIIINIKEMKELILDRWSQKYKMIQLLNKPVPIWHPSNYKTQLKFTIPKLTNLVWSYQNIIIL